MNYYIELKDKRNQFVFNNLQKLGHGVLEFELGKTIVCEGDTVVFSPARKFDEAEAKLLPEKVKIISGNLKPEVLNLLGTKQSQHFNLLSDETFVVKNANLTAEGVLNLIIKETEKSIFKNNILILGTGRVGTSIAVLLKQLNLNFAFVTYHENKLAYANFFTSKCYLNNSFLTDLNNFDIIINTIPAVVLENQMLPLINSNAVVLEVASVNCLNVMELSNYGFKYVLAPALPQVFSAQAAGEVMLESILTNTF